MYFMLRRHSARYQIVMLLRLPCLDKKPQFANHSGNLAENPLLVSWQFFLLPFDKKPATLFSTFDQET
jgi:hypothetical protein